MRFVDKKNKKALTFIKNIKFFIKKKKVFFSQKFI